MKTAIKIILTIIILFLAFSFIKFKFLNNRQTSLPSTFICNLVDRAANSAGITGTDLGIGLVRNNSLYLFFGDTNGGKINKNIAASTIAVAPKSATPDCADFTWPRLEPLKSAKKTGTDISTVPSGIIQIGKTVYLFAMRMTNWDFLNKNGNHGYGLLFKSDGTENFQETKTLWSPDSIHMNSAPIFGTSPDGKPVVYIYATGEYRKSGIYLAYVDPSQIENKSAYHYYPNWTTDISEATPLIDANAGELSAVYNSTLKKYLLMFSNYSLTNGGLKLYASDSPAGPFQKYSLNPCAKNSDWMKEGWRSCYGGYILPETFGTDGRDVYYTLSLWRPYTTVLMKTRL
ncbi:MAG: DUF4185 domain-containing protein [Candidatus Gracilibacteria bacterium]